MKTSSQGELISHLIETAQMLTLEQRVLAMVKTRQPVSPREIGRSLWRRGGYQDVLRIVDHLIVSGVLRKERDGNQKTLISLNEEPTTNP